MLRRLGTIVKWAVLLPVLLAIVLLSLANDQIVTVHLNPFDPGDARLSYGIALYQLGFLIFIVGVLFGGVIAWSGARRRRRLRRREEEAASRERADWRERRDEEAVGHPSAFLPRP